MPLFIVLKFYLAGCAVFLLLYVGLTVLGNWWRRKHPEIENVAQWYAFNVPYDAYIGLVGFRKRDIIAILTVMLLGVLLLVAVQYNWLGIADILNG